MRGIWFVLVVLGVVGPVWAQGPFYAGATVGADAGSRGAFDTLGAFAAAGGLVGVRLTDAWAVELHADRGFGESAEREHLEIYGHSTVQDRAAGGYAVLGAWSPRHGGRVGTTVTMGLALRKFRTHTLSVSKSDPDDPYPARLGVRYEDAGVGWSGGVFVPIALGGRWSIAPEVRVTVGLTGESFYTQVYPRVRVMWGF